jgi:hypothetical protein
MPQFTMQIALPAGSKSSVPLEEQPSEQIKICA